MSTITALFKEIASSLPLEERKKALLEFASLLNIKQDIASDDAITKLADQDELISLLQQEIGRLNRMIVSHSDGFENASRAGLDILGERSRQRRLEGYHDHHDDQLVDLSLSSAAIAYIEDARLRGTSGGKGFDFSPPPSWPFSKDAWKPKDVRRSLVIAGALIIAEIEKVDRASDQLNSHEE